MPWIRRRLRGAKIWVRCDAQGNPLATADGRVDVLYQTGGKLYRAAARNLEADDDPLVLSDEQAAPQGAADGRSQKPSPRPGGARPGQRPAGGALGASGLAAAPPDAIHIYTDGACTGNPGPMGIGVVILDGAERREVSEYLGVGTNNIAELTAILRGLELSPRTRPVLVYSDSAYALGLLGQNWKAKANQDLVARLRHLARGFQDVRWVKVAGHAGIPENERCDQLARDAILKRG